jgi:hypothetical protein
MSTAIRHIRSFAHDHDDIPAFHAAYLVGTFLAAALFNLGFFVVLILLHMCLDVVKYRDLHEYSWQMTIHAVLVESIVDIALFFIALTSAVYIQHTFALEIMSGIVRSEATLLRAVAVLVPKIEIVEHFGGILIHFKTYLHSPHPDLSVPLLRVHRWSVIVIAVCVALLFLAIPLYRGHEQTLVSLLQNELVPHL